ncbi:site-specific integrase [Marinoscillum pacificum]|uniref:site-specific integrase n=1 Tax=Marinoscillum pacificum TaxID=392723 RepID=UPI0021573CA7|nr:site-specific integrase [Marinoscillum pacificum]
MEKVTVSTILHKKRQLNDGRYPVRLRLTYRRKRKYFSLMLNPSEVIYLSEEDWEKVMGQRPKEKLKEIKFKLVEYEKLAEEIITEIEKKGRAFSFDLFESEFIALGEETSVFALFNSIIRDLESEERIGTAISYRNALNALKKFRNNRDLLFADLTVTFLKDFERHMRKNLSVTSIGIYMRSLRTIYNRAIDKSIVGQNDYPFRQYKIPSEGAMKRALTKQQVLNIYNYEALPHSSEWFAQNYWLLSYLCQGMNFTDIAFLKNENIYDGRINYIRRKTKRTAKSVKLLSIKITNKWLKKIADKLEINFKLTSYVARHSYATVLKRSGVATNIISESLGHYSEKTTQVYLDGFEKQVIDEANQHLL